MALFHLRLNNSIHVVLRQSLMPPGYYEYSLPFDQSNKRCLKVQER